MSETRVSLKRARELLAERGDLVGQSALSRYVTQYADALDPQKDGRETTIDFETLIQHRSENINRAASMSVFSAGLCVDLQGQSERSDVKHSCAAANART